MESCLYLITGPTAVGKTAMCLDIALKINAEVISCDSMQMYRGMDIGTAKATAGELAKVPHHCLDMLDVKEPGNIQKYQELARQSVGKVLDQGKEVLVTGGSGFYLKSFLEPVVDDVDVSDELRAEVESLLESSGLDAVVEKLLELNPQGVGDLDLQNSRRVTRALERCISSGMNVLELKERMLKLPKPYPGFVKKICVLSRSDEQLRSRIAQRTEWMLKCGLVEEVEALLQQGLGDNPVASNAIGYREVIAFIQGDIVSRDELSETLRQNTWKLVRKQKKWFRTQLPQANVIDLDQCTNPDLQDLFG
jgi:tRNA dimethylallyltransferase